MEFSSLLIVFCVILGSMILHELAHGVVAHWLGDDTAKNEGRLSLNPLVHIDWYMSVILPMILAIVGGPIFGGAKPVPINTRNLKWGEWGFALVAVAGPFVNFVLALTMFLIGYFTGFLGAGGIIGAIFTYGVIINLGFMVFNLLPIPPLDGSRVLYAVAPDGVRRVMERMEQFGIAIVLVLVVVFTTFIRNIMSGAIEAVLSFFYFLVGA